MIGLSDALLSESCERITSRNLLHCVVAGASLLLAIDWEHEPTPSKEGSRIGQFPSREGSRVGSSPTVHGKSPFARAHASA